MYSAETVANLFLSLDENRDFYDDRLIGMNSRQFIKGSARLNKFLQLAQNLYIAKYGQLLFPENIYAYDNGGLVNEIQSGYRKLTNKAPDGFAIDKETEDFLKRVFWLLKNASIEELIEISHQDPAWKEKARYYSLDEQKMSPLKYEEDYRERYRDALVLLMTTG